MKYVGHRKLFCEYSKLSKLNAFILLGYQTNTDPSILVYKFHPERTSFNMYAEYTRPQLTFLALVPCTDAIILVYKFRPERTGFNMYAEYTQLQLTFLAL